MSKGQEKARERRITMLTCYDYPTTLWENGAGEERPCVKMLDGTAIQSL
jgi:hypothetical protein